MISFQQFKKGYNAAPVIEIADLTLPTNIYWLKGENGSGKTTLLKCIAGLLPFDGTISVNDINLRQERTNYLRIVNYAEAEPIYPPYLTGNDLIHLYRHTKGNQKTNVADLIDALGINQYQNQKIGTYSSGMVKKLSLVLAFIGSPKLILLDEPLITLDKNAARRLQWKIDQYSQYGVAFILTSHQALELANPAKELQVHDKTINL
jgi:ABC-2 type transport system ATP-binding protein